jgi:hypothetical protein
MRAGKGSDLSLNSSIVNTYIDSSLSTYLLLHVIEAAYLLHPSLIILKFCDSADPITTSATVMLTAITFQADLLSGFNRVSKGAFAL